MGHLVRSLALAEALVERFDVVLLNGGPLPEGIRVPPGIEVVALPPIAQDAAHQLVSRDARYTAAEARTLRRDIILATYLRTAPAVIVLELFPFGRKKFAEELAPMLEAAHAASDPRPLIVSSVRDLLVTGRQHRQLHDDWAAATATRYLDAVLVHADPRFARLEESFAPTIPFGVPVHYSGFVVPDGHDLGPTPAQARHGLIVSAGGGLVGDALFRAAIEAHMQLWPLLQLPMTIITGPFLPEPAWQALHRMVQSLAGVQLLRFVPDLRSEIAGATVSISQCGYNTAMDLVRARVPALVVPFGEGGENEQRVRADRLEALGLLRSLPAEVLDGGRLAAEVLRLLDFRPADVRLSLDGARESARFLDARVQQHQGALV
jgi:predicted glycosyltransferase